jgi:hypothetical protein
MSATATRFRQGVNPPAWMAGPPPETLHHRPRMRRPPRPQVIELAEPRKLVGNAGPWCVGVMSDAPAELQREWLG